MARTFFRNGFTIHWNLVADKSELMASINCVAHDSSLLERMEEDTVVVFMESIFLVHTWPLYIYDHQYFA